MIPIHTPAVKGVVIHQCPTTLHIGDGKVVTGPVYAILAGESRKRDDGFVGGRLNFRDIMQTAVYSREFVYVIPTNAVTNEVWWYGYVRLGYRKWRRVPCPRPDAIYNRIPNRSLEHLSSVRQARSQIRRLQIPMFNPEYFSKSHIYDVIRAASLNDFLPDTESQLTELTLRSMLLRHPSVYLKPSGGSVGHGMIKIVNGKAGWTVSVLKRGKTSKHLCTSFDQLWRVVQNIRVQGRYVIQQAVVLLEYRGHPCDFRVLLQKQGESWHVVGRGVRVSGDGRITTHVPNGGSIADAETVLKEGFGAEANEVGNKLQGMVLRAAHAIDGAYNNALGEMSMDIGIDTAGHPWFFEANAKPMKFDEPTIRQASLEGVLHRLRELSQP